MGLTAVSLRRPGRPKAPEKTVRILRSGIARLSPDLCNDKKCFRPFVDKKKKRIVLKLTDDFSSAENLRVWFSSDAAKSGLISVTSVLRELGLNTKDASGEYAAKFRSQYQDIVIDLSRKLRKV